MQSSNPPKVRCSRYRIACSLRPEPVQPIEMPRRTPALNGLLPLGLEPPKASQAGEEWVEGPASDELRQQTRTKGLDQPAAAYFSIRAISSPFAECSA